MCRKLTAEQSRQFLQQCILKGMLKGRILQKLIPHNQISQVYGTCEIHQKVQPVKENVKLELNQDHHPLLTKLSMPQICRPLTQEQRHVAQTAVLEQSLSLTSQWPATHIAFTQQHPRLLHAATQAGAHAHTMKLTDMPSTNIPCLVTVMQP